MKHLIGILCLLLCAGTAQSLAFENGGKYNPARHSLFMLATFPDAPVLNDAFFLAQYSDQLRGVGWQTTHSKRKVALISPQHFLTATHYKATGSITFLDSSGNLQTFAVSNITKIYEDISIGTLEVPIPEELGIRPFPVSSVKGEGPTGSEVFYVGDSPPGHLHTFAVGRTGFWKSRNDKADLDSADVPVEHTVDRVFGITGDSGSPSFFLENGELLLLGHHYTGRQDYVLSLQARAVNEHMSPTGYSLDLRDAPPSGCGSGAAQGAFMTLAIVCWRKRSR